MIDILTAEAAMSRDRYATEVLAIPVSSLIERAGLAVAQCARDMDAGRVVAVCGGGNNGSDGIAAARILRLWGVDARVLYAAPESTSRADNLLQRSIAKNCAVPTAEQADIDSADVIIDALTGVGLRQALNEPYAALARRINSACGRVVSCDLPSGVNDIGAAPGEAVRADVTVTFAYMKQALVLYPGAQLAGEVRVADIGIPPSSPAPIRCLERADIEPYLNRAPYSNKGTWGRVLAIAGSEGMPGAAYLSALGAYRAGAGLVEIFTHKSCAEALTALLPEAVYTFYTDADDAKEKLTASLMRADSVLIGCGLSMSPAARALTQMTLSADNVPVVADADALNIAALTYALPKRDRLTITPHIGEMSRLAGVDRCDILRDLPGFAKRWAGEHGVTLLLKDARSVISDGVYTYINTSGCSALAKAGSGDVLCGITAALAARGMTGSAAAAAAAYMHGLAGERASQRLSITSTLARDVANALSYI